MIIHPRYVYILTRNDDKGFGGHAIEEQKIKKQFKEISLCVYGNIGYSNYGDFRQVFNIDSGLLWQDQVSVKDGNNPTNITTIPHVKKSFLSVHLLNRHYIRKFIDSKKGIELLDILAKKRIFVI